MDFVELEYESKVNTGVVEMIESLISIRIDLHVCLSFVMFVRVEESGAQWDTGHSEPHEISRWFVVYK